MEEWLADHHTPWDHSNPRRKSGWMDHPAVRLGLIAIGGTLLVAGILVVQRVKTQNAVFSPGDSLPAIDPAAELRELAPAEFERAKPAAKFFLDATSTQQLLSVVREPDRVEPLIEQHYSAEPPQPIEHVGLKLVDAADFGGRIFLRVAAELPDGRSAGLTLERGSEHYLVDWESFVGHSEVDWAAFKATAPNLGRSVRLRAYASFVTRYDPPYDDQNRYQAVGLLGQDGEQLFGYIERLDPKCIELRAKMAEAGKNQYEVIVRVRYPEKDWSKDVVEIVELVQTGWVEWNRKPAPKE